MRLSTSGRRDPGRKQVRGPVRKFVRVLFKEEVRQRALRGVRQTETITQIALRDDLRLAAHPSDLPQVVLGVPADLLTYDRSPGHLQELGVLRSHVDDATPPLLEALLLVPEEHRHLPEVCPRVSKTAPR